MSAELPELERLLVDAAERRCRDMRRARTWWPLRGVRVAGAVAVMGLLAVVVLAAAPRENDERAVDGGSSQPAGDERLASAYRAFGRPAAPLQEVDPDGVALEVVESTPPRRRPGAAPGEPLPAGEGTARPMLDLGRPVRERTLYERDGIRVAAWTGAARRAGGELTCFPHWFDGVLGSGGCFTVEKLLAEREPFFLLGDYTPRTGERLTALVRDDIVGVTARLDNGRSKPFSIVGNIAYVRSREITCALRWTARDGAHGTVPLDIPGGCR